MSIDLKTHNKQLLGAWKDVCDDNNTTGWALFGYEGKSNTLKVVETGDGGIEDLIDELNSSKVMYAFCRVLDPNTQLPKFVLINWSGEAVPTTVRGTCANHVRYVHDLFRGAHVVINARSEDDVDPDFITDKVSKASGSNYSFHKESAKPSVPIEVVGTNYQPARLTLNKDIDVQKRDQFWQKVQSEDKERKRAENVAASTRQTQLDDEMKQREAKEAAERQEQISAKHSNLGAGAGKPPVPLRAEAASLIKQGMQQKRKEEKVDVLSKTTQESRAEEAARLAQAGHKFHQQQQSETIPSSSNQVSSLRNEAAELIHKGVAARETRDAVSATRGSVVKQGIQQPWKEEKVDVQSNTRQENRAEEAARLAQAGHKFHQQHQSDTIPSFGTQASSLRNEAADLIRKGVAAREKQDDVHATRGRSESKAEEAARLIREGQAFHAHDEEQRREETRATRSKRVDSIETEESVQQVKVRDDRHYVPVPQSRVTVVSSQNEASKLIRQGIDEREKQGRVQEIRTKTESKADEAARLIKVGRAFHQRDTEERQMEARAQNVARAQEAEVLIKGAREQLTQEVSSKRDALTSQYNRTDDADLPRETVPKFISEQTVPASNQSVQEPYQPKQDSSTSTGYHKEPQPVEIEQEAAGITVRALYEYIADDISFNPGDYISNIEKVDENWWMGTNGLGNRGLFPVNYVEQLSAELQKQVSQAVYHEEHKPVEEVKPTEQVQQEGSGLTAKALYDYQADAEDEVSFGPGDTISDIEMVDEGWWIGTNSAGSRGMFPANYVELLK